MMKMLSGQLVETQYSWPQDSFSDPEDSDDDEVYELPMQVTQRTVLGLNQVAYIHDKIGLHRVGNPSLTAPAVSLHLYAPPYDMCRTFEESSGRARASGTITFYSVGGQRL
jgi:cysteine dioxygenase